jgi:23S rRNA (uracil1939-C5)-methyltransferase
MPARVHDLTLATLAYGGEALGRLEDGRAVFVPFALPGERVRVRLIEERERFARGELIELVQSAPERITPLCKHFGTCGGCQYQHMPYEMQLAAKAQILGDQLVRIGHVENPPVQPTVGSSRQWNYRNHVQFHVTADGRVGYIPARGERDPSLRAMAIQECHLPEPAVNLLWPHLEFEAEADVERVSIRAGTDGELLLTLESASPEPPELEVEAEMSVTHTFEGRTLILAGEDHVFMRVRGREFRVSATSFFQVNTDVAERMIEHVAASLPSAVSTLLDVYCGVGLFSAFLAARCKRLVGIESSPAACDDYMLNLDEFDHVELYEDVAERVLPALELQPEAVIVDPPRAGLELTALNALARMRPQLIAYVSCDPSTLARDSARLIHAGYRLLEVTPFDLFPQTYHIESISIFEK